MNNLLPPAEKKLESFKESNMPSRAHRFAYFMQELAEIYPGAFLQRAARLWPQRRALFCDAQQLTFKELYDKTLALSQYLLHQGVTPQSRIIILYENSITFYCAYYGAWQTGAVIVPVNTFLQTHELEHIINDCDAHTIIASEKQTAKIPVAMRTRILSEQQLNELIQQTAPEIVVPAKQRDELAALLYTSGTTGLPKGVMLSPKNIITNAVQTVCEFTISSEERIYAALPLFHSYLQNACLWSAIIVGATTIIVPKIDRTALAKGLQHLPTVVLGIPQLFGLFCLLKNISFPAVKFFFSGGDALPDKIRIAFELTFRRKICNGYGLTEAGPVVSVHLTDDYTATNCVGRPVLGLEVALFNEDGTPTQDGIGILALRGDNIMMGYWMA
jgi:acyl-CoA synthetase (AMP-forming)/AMP-acid ligase II